MPKRHDLLSREQAHRAGYELAIWDEFVAFGREESLPEYARAAFYKYLASAILPQLKSTRKMGRVARALKEQQLIWDDILAWDVVRDYREEQGWYKIPKDVREASKIVKLWQEDTPLPRSLRSALADVGAWGAQGRPHPITYKIHAALEALRQWREHGECKGIQPSSPKVRLAFETVKWWNDHGMKAAPSRKFSNRQAYQMASEHLGVSASGIRAACARAQKRQRNGFYVSELFLRTIKIS